MRVPIIRAAASSGPSSPCRRSKSATAAPSRGLLVLLAMLLMLSSPVSLPGQSLPPQQGRVYGPPPPESWQSRSGSPGTSSRELPGFEQEPAFSGATEEGQRTPMNEAADELDFTGLFFWTGAIIFFICLCFLILKKILPRRRGLFSADAIRVLARRALNSHHTLYLVEIGPRILRLTASKDRVAYLGEFADPMQIAVVKSLCPGGDKSSEAHQFRATLNETIEESELTLADTSENTFEQLQGELENIRQTVESWRHEE